MRKLEVSLSKDALRYVSEMLEYFSNKHDVSELTRDDVIEMCIETTYRAFKRGRFDANKSEAN
jgi:hypothetical protein